MKTVELTVQERILLERLLREIEEIRILNTPRIGSRLEFNVPEMMDFQSLKKKVERAR